MTLIKQNKIHWQMQKDLAKRAMGPENNHLKSEEIIKKFKGKLLDWGCGVGRFYPLFKKYVDYYGVDIMPEMLTYFKEDNPGVLNLQLIDGFKTKFDSNSFDIIWCWSVFTHSDEEDVTNILKEWKRILKEDGEIYCSVMFGDVEKVTSDINLIYFNKEYFLGLIKKEGFNYKKVLEVHEIEDIHQTLFKLVVK